MEAHNPYLIQKTIEKAVTLKGIGVHSGEEATVTLQPADPGHGIVFQKHSGGTTYRIEAHFRNVISTHSATNLGLAGKPDSHIGTVEHLLSACYGLGITNLLVDISGKEVPILDGSSAPFVDAILAVGISPQFHTTSVLRIKKPIKIYENDVICELLPREELRLTTSIDFKHPKIGLQIYALDVSPEAFASEVARARTFGFLKDVEMLKRHNLALGASLENVVAFSSDEILNPEGLRYEDECARHKLLDALGDLSLCGCYIQGEMVSFRGGHAMHLRLLQSLDAHADAWEIIPGTPIRVPSGTGFRDVAQRV